MKSKPRLIVGFLEERDLVEKLAKSMSLPFELALVSQYRAGEIHIKGPKKSPAEAVVFSNVDENPETFFKVLLLADSLRECGAKRIVLIAPWIAYGRQDRSTEPGEAPAGLVVARLLSDSFDRIITLDAHSLEFIKAFKGKLANMLIEPDEIERTCGLPFDLVVAPDFGASHRAKRLADYTHLKYLVLKKIRHNGRVRVSFQGAKPDLIGARILMVDDMADSGSTLAEAAKLLKKAGARSIAAFVTHAMDGEKLAKNLKPLISPVTCAYNHKNNHLISSGLLTLMAGL
ncbi:MAG: ribose-phosphate diphosphokinase [Patescibacteria group bacterium]